MKFNDWTLESLIEHLKSLQSASSERLDYQCVTRCSGEISVYNGERKDGSDEVDVFGL